MNIVFFSTNAHFFPGDDIDISTFPSCASRMEALASSFPEHRFTVATQLPGSFLCDPCKNRIGLCAEGVNYVLLQGTTPSSCAEEICALNPDLAIPASFWSAPYDWLSLGDSLAAEELSVGGVKTVSHSVETQMISFDKKSTHDFLFRNNFPVPNALYVHHELFWAERGHREVKTNEYKEYIFSRLRKMNYPVVIKDTVGLSSYGMEVAVSFKEAVHYLRLGKTNSDRLVEEYIDGLHFGTEIYGKDGKYTVMPPLIFSLNRYGITSPRLSVKIGPVQKDEFCIDDLKKSLLNLAEKMNLSGAAQVDLIFKDKKWYIIEVNPRLSGMSETYASSMGISVQELLLRIAEGRTEDLECKTAVCNFKIPQTERDVLEKISLLPGVSYVNQVKNQAARQEREKGYCEIVVNASSVEEIPEVVRKIESLVSGTVVPEVISKIDSLTSLF